MNFEKSSEPLPNPNEELPIHDITGMPDVIEGEIVPDIHDITQEPSEDIIEGEVISSRITKKNP